MVELPYLIEDAKRFSKGRSGRLVSLHPIFPSDECLESKMKLICPNCGEVLDHIVEVAEENVFSRWEYDFSEEDGEIDDGRFTEYVDGSEKFQRVITYECPECGGDIKAKSRKEIKNKYVYTDEEAVAELL